MPTGTLNYAPVDFMTAEQRSTVRALAAEAMADVAGSAIKARQVRISLPSEAEPIGEEPYKPFIRFHFRRETVEELDRNADTLKEMCHEAAVVLYRACKVVSSGRCAPIVYSGFDGVNNVTGSYSE